MTDAPVPPSPAGRPLSGDLPANTVIGRYRLLRRIGEGGMGTVFEAEQQDPRRRVAIKVLRQPLALSEQAVALFHREIQALARLRHPSIATIHEAGTTRDGLQYFAMELVPGVPLSEWLAARPLTPKVSSDVLHRRLAIFRQICTGAGYAHLRGVIHRDLKPLNIMIRSDEAAGDTGGVEVKILDFGLALVQDAEITAAGLTDPGTVRGTLAYMSPEQTGGNPYEVDSRSDVYALGVILYELLTGRLPYQTHGKSPLEVLAQLSQQDPIPPSRVWRELRWNVEPDLETIVLKALAKDPDERYQSVSALSDDVGLLEAGLPIQARPPTLRYQLRKLVRRHKLPTALLAVLGLVLVAGALVTTVQRDRARRAEAGARSEAQKSQAVVQFLERMLGSADPYRGSQDMTVAQVLSQAAREIPFSFGAQPGVESAVRRALGRTYLGLGRYAEAEEQLRLAMAAAERAPDRTELGGLDLTDNLAELRWRQGRYREADSISASVLARKRELLGSENLAVSHNLNFLGAVAYATNELARGDSLLQQAIAIRTRLVGPTDLLVAESRDNLASIRFEQGEYAAAESLLSSSLALRRQALGRDHPDIASTLDNLAMALSAQERFADAEPYYREALETTRRVFGENHPAVARNLNNFGMFYQRQGKLAEAEPWLRSGLALNQKLFGRDNGEVAIGLNNLALVALGTGRLADAYDLFTQALDVTARVHGANSPIYAQYLKSLASAQARGGKIADAERNYRRVLALQRGIPGLPAWDLETTHNMLGDLYVTAKRYPEAEQLFRSSFPVIRAQFGDGHGRTRTARSRFIKLYEQWGRAAQADSVRKLDSTAIGPRP